MLLEAEPACFPTASSSNKSGLCFSSLPSNQTCQKEDSDTQWAVYPLLLLGQLLLGIGAVPIQPFGISYIDDYASRRNSPLYLGRRPKINFSLVENHVDSVAGQI